MGWWRDIWKTRAKDWTLAPLSADQVPDKLKRSAIEPGTKYLNVWLRSLRLTDVRKGLRKFYGTTHSLITLDVLGRDKAAEFQMVTTPQMLKDQDVQHLDRVIVMNQRLLGPIPYRGGDIGMEVGLFSIASADLAAPFLGTLEKMSSVAGVSFLSAALPFAEPLKEGINLLTGASGDSTLEIGLAMTTSKPESGSLMVMRAERGEVEPSDLTLDPSYRLLDKTGAAVTKYPYIVVAIEAASQRDDWFKIPDVLAAYQTIQGEVRKGDFESARAAFTTFRRIVLTSPDLLITDAQTIVAKVESELSGTLKPAMTAAGAKDLVPLERLSIYK